MGGYSINIPINTPGADKLDAILASIGRVEAAIKGNAASWGALNTAIAGTNRVVAENSTVMTANVAAVNSDSVAVRNLGGAHGKLITDVQASSAAIRAFEGNMSIRAVEQFTTKLLGLGNVFQTIFPVVGAIMFAEVVGQMISKVGELYNAWNPVVHAEERALSVAEELTKQYEKIFQKAEQIRYARIGIERGPEAEMAAKATDKRGEAAMNAGAIAELRNRLKDQQNIVAANTMNSLYFGKGYINETGRAAQIKAQGIAEKIAGMEFQQRTNLQDAGLEDIRIQDSQRKKMEADAKRYASEASGIRGRIGSLADTAAMMEMTPVERIEFKRRKDLMEFGGGILGGDNGLRSSINQSYDTERGVAVAKLLRSMGLRADGRGGIMRSEDGGGIELADIGGATLADETGMFTRNLRRSMAGADKDISQLGGALNRYDRSDATGIMQRFGRAQRFNELAAGPGGEGGATVAAYQQRLELAQKLYEIDMRRVDRTLDAEEKIKLEADATFEKRKEEGQALIDLQVKLMEMHKQDREMFQGFMSGLVGASFGGGGSISNYLRSQGQGILTHAASNATGMLFPNGAPNILGGITGTAENPSMIGRLLSGTIFGPKASDPLKIATDMNTAATIANTQVLAAVSGIASPGGGFGSGGGTAGGIFSGAGGPLGMIFKGFSGGGSSGFGSFGGEEFSDSFDPTGGGTSSIFSMKNAGAFGGAALGGVIGGTQLAKGGIRNIMTGTASLAGAAAALMTLSPTLGPAAPFVAAGAGALALVAGLLGDPKQRRSNQIANNLKYNQFVSPVGLNISESTGGGFSDYDKYGNVRTSDLSPFPSVLQPYFDYRNNTTVPGTTLAPFGGGNTNITINAMDSQSFHSYLVNNPDAMAAGVVAAANQGGNQMIPILRDAIA